MSDNYSVCPGGGIVVGIPVRERVLKAQNVWYSGVKNTSSPLENLTACAFRERRMAMDAREGGGRNTSECAPMKLDPGVTRID